MGTWMLVTLLKVIFTLTPLTSKSLTTAYTFYRVQKTVELIYCNSGLSNTVGGQNCWLVNAK